MYCLGSCATNNEDVIQRNPKLLNFRYEFEKLSNDEILTYQYETSTDVEFFMFDKENGVTRTISDSRINLFKLYARNTITEKERLIDAWQTFSGGYQFSLDKKTGIFFLGSNSWFGPLLKIDGRAGVITYLMDIDGSARSNKNLDYVLYHAKENKNLQEELKLVLIDLHKVEVAKVFNWDITPLFACDSLILRSKDDRYDFMLDYGGESFLYAIAYYNIEYDILDTVFDVTGYKESAWRHAREGQRYTSSEFGK